jgi:hypothetical protein
MAKKSRPVAMNTGRDEQTAKGYSQCIYKVYERPLRILSAAHELFSVKDFIDGSRIDIEGKKQKTEKEHKKILRKTEPARCCRAGFFSQEDPEHE